MLLCYDVVASPVGPLFIGVDGDGFLTRISFLADKGPERVLAGLEEDGFETIRRADAVTAVVAELDAYFAKTLTRFSLPLKPCGTSFQREVWDQLCQIPYGTCVSYGDIAKALGQPGASRAVGLANNRNPIPIVIPCHRVIGAQGQLTGFGGGTDIKHQLLVHEGYFLL